MKDDAIGVLVKDDHGKVKEQKLGKRAGKRGMGIGVALGVVAAIPTAASPWSEGFSEAAAEAPPSASSSTTSSNRSRIRHSAPRGQPTTGTYFSASCPRHRRHRGQRPEEERRKTRNGKRCADAHSRDTRRSRPSPRRRRRYFS
jgi:hypothetical protein